MKNFLSILYKLLLIVLAILIGIVISYFSIGYSMYKDAITKTPIEDKIAEIKSKPNYTELSDIPKIYKDAVIAVEDHRFYDHLGVDYIATFNALIYDLFNGALKQGGSTITQQLCKNIYFTQERKLQRKIAEIIMAAELERTVDKEIILELYINTCFYGNNCYTLKEATNLYFKKDPIDLTDYEATLTAGIPNAPSLYNPFHSMELCTQRQKQVLSAMVKYEYITQEERDKILSQ